MTNVPLIDVAPARHGGRDERCRVAAAIDGACHEIGFFAISGHGVLDRLVDDLRRLAHDFFGLPLADKLRCRHPVEGTNRGYHPVGGETLSKANDAAAPPDLKEFFHVGPVDTTADSYYTGARGRRHFEPNIWPAVPAGLAEAATIYYRAMSELVVFLMRLAAIALDVRETFFDDKVDRSIGTMRLNYYPGQTVPPSLGQLRASAHTDYGGFTILSGEDVPGGLQVRTRDGRWIEVTRSGRAVFAWALVAAVTVGLIVHGGAGDGEATEPAAGAWTGGAAVGFLGNTPDGTAFAMNLNVERFFNRSFSVGPLLQFGVTGDMTQIAASGQVKYWMDLSKGLKLTAQGGLGFVHTDFRGSDTSFLIPIGVGDRKSTRLNSS